MNGLIPTAGTAVFDNISRLESRHQIGESRHDGMSRSVTNELSAVLQYLEELSDSCVYWLVVSTVSTPLKNMSSSVGIIIPNIWKNIKNVPNYQPV